MELNDGMDFIMRPVLRQMCRYESLLDGSIGMLDLARMNDTLDVFEENERRVNSQDK